MTPPADLTLIEQVHALLEQSRDAHNNGGRLDEAEAIARQALDLAERLFETDPRNVDVRAAFARACSRLGNVCDDSDQPDEAEAAHRQALPLYQELVAAHPESVPWRVDLAVANGELGRLLVDNDRKDDAVPLFRHARVLWKQLASEDPGDLDFQDFLADTCFTLGYLLAEAGQATEAEQFFKECQTAWEPLLAIEDYAAERHYFGRSYLNLALLYRTHSRPQEAEQAANRAVAEFETLQQQVPSAAPFARRDLVRTLGVLRSLHFAAGQVAQARTVQQRLAAAWQDLAEAEPADPEHLRRLALSYSELANWFWDIARRLDEAETALLQGLAVWQQLAQAHPGPENEFGVVETYYYTGFMYWNLKRPDGAEEAYRRALLRARPLVRAHPDVPAYISRLASCHNQLGIVYVETGRLDRARREYRKALLLRRRLVQEQPENGENAIYLGGILCNLGNVACGQRRFEAALTWYRRSIRWLKEVAQKHGLGATGRQYLANARAGRADAAMPTVVPAQAQAVGAVTGGFRLAGPPPRFPDCSLPHPAGGPDALDGFLAAHPDDVAGWFWKARALGQAGRYAEALAALDRVLIGDPDHAAAGYDRADLLRYLGREKEALNAVRRLLKANRHDANAWHLRGLILGEFLDGQGGAVEPFDPDRNDRAVKAFDNVLLRRPDDFDARLYKGLALYRGCCAAQAGYRALLAGAVHGGMTDAAARAYLLPEAQACEGYFTRARESFDHATRLQPRNACSWYHKGRLLMDLEGRHEATAEEAFTHAVACDAGLADAWFELARLADRRNDRLQALAHLRRAVTAHPERRQGAREAFAWLAAGDLGE